MADLFGGQAWTVWLLVAGMEVETPFAHVQSGDTVVVQAGQMIPVDGVITHGVATIDQHTLTGEVLPGGKKGAGERAGFDGSVDRSPCDCRRTSRGMPRAAAQITHMLNQTTDFKEVLRSYRGLAQPHAAAALGAERAGAAGGRGQRRTGGLLVLSRLPHDPLWPAQYVELFAGGRERGILIKDGRALESLQDVDTVVFDKTGTLTLEQPTVSRIFCCNGVSEADILRYAAAAEAKQSHPIARAILQATHDYQLICRCWQMPNTRWAMG